MKLSRRNKYLTVIAFCGAALLVDRFVLPRSATAEGALEILSVRPRTPVEADAKPVVTRVLPVPEIPFPKNIRTIEPHSTFRDFFVSGNQGKSQPADGSRAAESNSPEITAMASEFETKHKLSGVMFNESVKIAVLGDLWVELGHEVDGCFLKKLEVDTATFACPGRDVILTLHKPQ